MIKRISRVAEEKSARMDGVEARFEIRYLRPLPNAAQGRSVRRRQASFPVRRVLVWCAALLFAVAAMAIALGTLGEITRRVISLGERDAPVTRDP
jgi:hypothetical protein